MSSTIIQCQQLSKQFTGKLALDNISFEIQAGQPVALVGPNGAGKTTLLSILSGYLRPNSGTVRLFGHKPGSSALFGRLSALPQDAQLDGNFSIIKQLSLYARLQGMTRQQASNEAWRVLELMHLQEAGNEQPAALSHGMAKRAAIAQALIGQAELVLLDEPTAGLDPANARNIRQIVSELSVDTTFIISSHNLAELERLCSTVLHLDKGQLQIQTESSGDQRDSYLTIHMMDPTSGELLSTLQQMPGVLKVKQQHNNEFIICYDARYSLDLDQKLLACLANKGWNYRQLIKGKTLEEKLFSED